MAGILDLLFGGGQGGGGVLPPWLQGQQQQQPQQDQQAPPMAQPGMAPAAGSGNPLLAGLMSFGNSRTPLGGLANAIGAFSTGERTDPGAIAQNQNLRDYLFRQAEAQRQQGNVNRQFNEAPYTQSPEYLAKIEEQKAAIEQKYGKPMPVPPGTSLYQPGAPGQEGKVVLHNDVGQLPPHVVDQLADQVNAGDMTPLQQQGYGPIGTLNRAAINNRAAEKRIEAGQSGAGQAAKRVEYQAETAAGRATANREVAVQTPASEFKRMAPIAIEASEALDRTNYPNINALTNAVQKGVGGENVMKAHTALTSVGNIYARVISPTGQSTDSTRSTAYSLLNEGLAKGQVKAVIELMGREIAAAETGVKDVQTERLRNFLQKNGIKVPHESAGTSPTSAPAGAPAASAPASAIPSAPPPDAVQALRKNPKLLQQFEMKYGPGSAQRALNEM